MDSTDPSAHPGGWVGAIRTDTMTYQWKHNDSTGVPLYVAAEDAVFVGYDNGTVAALDPVNGSTVWVNNAISNGKEYFGTCVYDGPRKRLYCDNMYSGVLALDAKTGHLEWSQTFDGILAEILGPAITDDNQHLIVGDYHGNLVSLRLDD